jgi:hypothetical protein
MPDITITGGCYCGAVRYSITQSPIYISICYCDNCRRAVGAQSVAWITVDSRSFTIVQGTPARFRTDTAAWRTFCSVCGTSLTYQSDKEASKNWIDITIGSLDHPEAFAPRMHVWPEERLAWEPLLPLAATT